MTDHKDTKSDWVADYLERNSIKDHKRLEELLLAFPKPEDHSLLMACLWMEVVKPKLLNL